MFTYIPNEIPTDPENYFQLIEKIYATDELEEQINVLINIVKDTFDYIRYNSTPADNTRSMDKLNSNIELYIQQANSFASTGKYKELINILYQEEIQQFSKTFLSLLINPTEHYIKNYIEINYEI